MLTFCSTAVFSMDIKYYAFHYCSSLCFQIKAHEHQFLPSAQSGVESFWIPSVFPKSDTLIKGKGFFVFGYHFQFHLDKSGIPGTFDASLQ